MSTGNFMIVNASKVYEIKLKNEYELKILKDNFIYKVANTFHVSPEESQPSADTYNLYFSDRNYPSENISSILIFPFTFHQVIPVYIPVYIHFYLTSGYYEEACFDYDIEFFPYNKFTLSEYKSLEDFRDDIIELGWIIEPNIEQFKKEFIPAMQETIKLAENLCKQMSNSILEHIGTFSNGEKIYKNINYLKNNI